MTLAAALRHVRREGRGSRGKLAFLVVCLSVGVAAVVSVAGLASSLDQGIRADAKQLLAADLVVAGRHPVPPSVDSVLSAIPGAKRADVKELTTVVSAAPKGEGPGGTPLGRSQLVELKAVAGGYPFYGSLRLEPGTASLESLGEDGALVAPELLTRLGLAIGDDVRIGGIPFRIRGLVLSEPDRVRVSFTLGPRVLLTIAGLTRTRLETFGGRIYYRALVKLPPGSGASEATEAARRLSAAVPEGSGFEVETYAEAQPELREGLARADRFLGLLALLSLLVGGVGVAQTIRAWVATRMDSIAILKCLGMRPRETLALYLGQAVLLGIVGSLAGVAFGTAVLLVAPRLLGSLLPAVTIRVWQPWAVFRGLGLGVGVALLFGLPPVLEVLRVRPARVFRRDAEPIPWSRSARIAAAGVLLAGVFAIAWTQARSAVLGAWFTIGIFAAVGLLALASTLLTRAVLRLSRNRTRVWLRHGLRGVARPGAGTLGAIVALGLGVLVVLGMYLVHTRFTSQLQAELPRNAPTTFVIGIQPDQWPRVRELLESAGALRLRTVPIVTARLTAIDGRPVAESIGPVPEEGRKRWVRTREQNLTYLEKLPDDNKVVEGALWSDPKHPEISIERDFARDLGVHVGSSVRFDVQGVPIDLAVTSLRTVDWKTFGINFFLVVEPGVLEDAPQSRVAAMSLSKDSEQHLEDELAAAYPNVTLLKVREVLDKIVAILDRLALAVRLLGGFTVLAGIAILAGAVSAGSARRGREVALLKTLGMTRGGVVLVFAVEYALVGLVAGGIGVAGAALLSWAVATRGMEIPWKLDPTALALAFAATIVLSIAAGIGASARSLTRRPIEVLREE